MNRAYARPLVVGSPKMSARIPATMAMGELANTPVKKRNTSRADQLGARAQAMVKAVKQAKVARLRSRRPKCSLRGPQMMGPKT